MGETDFVRIVREGPVATVTLNRPDVHNAFNEHVIAQLKTAFDELAIDTGVRIIVLRGEGKSFSAGADLDWMRRAAEWSEEENRRDAANLAAMLRAIAECPKPVVARVQGSAFGGGAGLVAASDIAVAAESAMLGFTEVRLGLVPATIAPHVVARIGAGHALALFLTGERFDAQYAQTIGLVHRVVPDGDLDGAVNTVVEALLAGGPKAQARCKELVRRAASATSSGIDTYTAELIGAVRSSAEGRDGVRAFLEKRKPKWAQPNS